MAIGPARLRRGAAPAADSGERPEAVEVRTELPEPAEPAEPVATPPPPPAREWSWPDLAVGATIGAAGAAVALVGTARRAAVRSVSDGPDRAARFGGHARDRIAGVAQRGAAQRLRSRRWAESLVDAAGTAVATSPIVNRVIDLQINRVLRPLVSSVLDDVLALLEAEPDRVRSLVRGQREGIVDDVVAHIRSSATIGDATVDRWTSRILRRAPAPDPDAAPTLADGAVRIPGPP